MNIFAYASIYSIQTIDQDHTLKDLSYDIAKFYDDAPYESFPFHQSHPTHLFTIATLF